MLIESFKPAKERKRLSKVERKEMRLAFDTLAGIANRQIAEYVGNRPTMDDLEVYNSFFEIPGESAVLRISTNGHPDIPEQESMFLYVHVREEDAIKEVLTLQLSNMPRLARNNELNWLSNYSVAQLITLAHFVDIATPIESEEYDLFLGN